MTSEPSLRSKTLWQAFPVTIIEWADCVLVSCEGMIVFLRKWRTLEQTVGWLSCGKAYCWWVQPVRRAAAGSGWKSEKVQLTLLTCAVKKKIRFLFMQHSLQGCWCLGFIRTDDEQRKEDREQATTKTNHRNHIIFCYLASTSVLLNKKRMSASFARKRKTIFSFLVMFSQYKYRHHLISLRYLHQCNIFKVTDSNRY